MTFSVINTSQSIRSRLAVTALCTAFFMPFSYLMDRAMYRSYLRRSGQRLPPRGAPKKR